MQTRSVISIVSLCAALASTPALAINYFELEVYPYATAGKGEVELENMTTYTSRGTRDVPPPDNNKGLTRSTFEVNYGVTDRSEIAFYSDYAHARGEDWRHAATRVRGRTRFFEKGELPIDLGLYAEVEFPKDEDNDLEFEVRGIIEKDVGRWTFDFNPILEKVIKGADKGEEWEFQYAVAAIYRLNDRYRPRLEFFGEFEQPRKHLVSPAVDITLGQGVALRLGAAFGLTDAAEQRLLRTQLEWEFY